MVMVLADRPEAPATAGRARVPPVPSATATANGPATERLVRARPVIGPPLAERGSVRRPVQWYGKPICISRGAHDARAMASTPDRQPAEAPQRDDEAAGSPCGHDEEVLAGEARPLRVWVVGG